MIIRQLTPDQFMLTGIKTAWEGFKESLIKKGHKVTKGGEYDIAYATSIDPITYFRLKSIKGKPKIIRAATTKDDLRGAYLIFDLFYKIIIKYLTRFYSKADRIITISKFAKKSLIEMGVKKKIDVVSCGVNLEKFKYSLIKRNKFRSDYKISDEDIVVLCVGMPTMRKGIDLFIELARRFPKVKFYWVGKEIRFKTNWLKVKRLIKNKTSNVVFTGYVDDIVSAYCGADILLFPTRSENEGLPVLEAGACKLPVIANNLPVLREKIKNGVNGFLCNNIDEFTKRLKQLINSRSLRRKLGYEANKMAKRYDIQVTTEKLIRMFNECL